MKKAIPGLLISALLIYLSVKGTDFHGIADGLIKMSYRYILPFLLTMLIMQILRVWRWGLILYPLGKIGHLPLFAIASVGFLAIIALPARLGELGRPYLVSRNSSIKMSAALGTVFVERIIDGITILTIASLTTFFTTLPGWLLKANLIFFIFNLVLVSVVFFAVHGRGRMERLLNSFLRVFPEKWGGILTRLLRHFLDGFLVIGNGRQLLQILLLSFLIWFVDVLAIYILFEAFNFTLPPVAAFVLMIILIIGIAIPTAPGFIGNWHFSCILGLGLFGVAKTEAFTFALIYHFLSVGLVVILGIVFLPAIRFSFADLWKETKNTLS
jgi:hypothetical protein